MQTTDSIARIEKEASNKVMKIVETSKENAEVNCFMPFSHFLEFRIIRQLLEKFVQTTLEQNETQRLMMYQQKEMLDTQKESLELQKKHIDDIRTFEQVNKEYFSSLEDQKQIIEKCINQLPQDAPKLSEHDLGKWITLYACPHCGQSFSKDEIDKKFDAMGINLKSMVLSCKYPECGKRFSVEKVYKYKIDTI